MKTKSQSGFTLIEILICLAIISFITCMSMPKFNVSQYSLNTISKSLCMDIRQTKLSNMTDIASYKMFIYSNKYEMYKGIKLIKRVQLPKEIIITYNFSHYYSGYCEISFGPNGVPNNCGTICICLNNVYKKITIVPASGRILLYDEIFKK